MARRIVDSAYTHKYNHEVVRQVLDQAGIKHIYYGSPGTAHEWQTWRRDLNDFAPRLFR